MGYSAVDNTEARRELWNQIKEMDDSTAVRRVLRLIRTNGVDGDFLVPKSGDDEAKIFGEQTFFDQVDLEDPNRVFVGFDPKTQSILSIINIVMDLVALSGMLSHSALWKQASEAMQAQLKLAKPMARAVMAAAQARADGTRLDAHKQFWSGVVNIGVAAMTMIMAYNGIGSDKVGSGSGSANEGIVDNAQAPADSANAGGDQANNNPAQAANEAAAGAKEAKGFFSAQNIKDMLQHAVNASSFASIFGKIAEGFLGSYFDGQKATKQEEEGTQDAISKEIESFSQFWAQFFNRTHDQLAPTQQLIDQALRTIKDATDNVLASLRQLRS